MMPAPAAGSVSSHQQISTPGQKGLKLYINSWLSALEGGGHIVVGGAAAGGGATPQREGPHRRGRSPPQGGGARGS